jgi:hypothetical protein
LLSATLLPTTFLWTTTGTLSLFLFALALAAALLAAPLLSATLVTTLLAAALAAFPGSLSWFVRILFLFHVYLSLFSVGPAAGLPRPVVVKIGITPLREKSNVRHAAAIGHCSDAIISLSPTTPNVVAGLRNETKAQDGSC